MKTFIYIILLSGVVIWLRGLHEVIFDNSPWNAILLFLVGGQIVNSVYSILSDSTIHGEISKLQEKIDELKEKSQNGTSK